MSLISDIAASFPDDFWYFTSFTNERETCCDRVTSLRTEAQLQLFIAQPKVVSHEILMQSPTLDELREKSRIQQTHFSRYFWHLMFLSDK